MAYMKKHHNFDTSKYQYERHFKKWKFRKNCSKDEWKFVRDRIEKRKIEGKESEVYFNGALIPGKKIKKEVSRHFPPTFNRQGASAARPQTPEGISICTPRSMDLYSLTLENLPWFQFQNHVQSQEAYFQSFFINDRYSQDLIGVQTFANSPSIPLDFESLLSCLPEPTGMTKLIPDIPAKTLCFLLQGLTATKIKKNSLRVGTDILPYLHATLLERQPGELMASIQNIIEPGNAKALPHFLNLAIYLLSNNLMTEIKIDQFLQWFIDNGHRVLLGSFFSVKLPTIEALAQAIFRSALRIGDAYLIQSVIDSDAKLNICSPSRGYGPTPLEEVVARGNIELAQIILANDVHDDMADCRSRAAALYKAVRLDNVALVQLLLNAGANVTSPESRAVDTLLQEAAEYGSTAVTQMLLNAGANVNAPASSYGTALQQAVRSDNLKLVQLLLEAGANVNAPASRYGTALQQAVRSGKLKLVELLLENGADVNAAASQDVGTALQEAAKENNIAIVRLLLNFGADINAPASWNGYSALQEAVKRGNTALVQLLLAAGADLNRLGFKGNGNTAFEPAELQNKIELIRLLRNAGADDAALAVGSLHQELLLEAVEKDDTDRIQQLLDMGVDVNYSPDIRIPSLHLAVRKGNIEIVRALLAAGADVNATGPKSVGEETALRKAVGQVIYEMQEGDYSEEYDSGEDNTEEDNTEEDATEEKGPGKDKPELISNSTLANKLELVETLLKAGADANEYAKYDVSELDYRCLYMSEIAIYGMAELTALQAAALATREGEDVDLVQLLLRAGADVNAPAADENGRTALQAAAAGGNITLVRLLLSKGATVNARAACYHGRTALQAAAEVNDLNMVRLLLSVGADVNAPRSCKYGNTALQAAVELSKLGSEIELVQVLLNAGANVHGQTEDTWPGKWPRNSFLVGERKKTRTPLQAAAEGNNTRLIRLLLERGANVNAQAQYSRGRTALQAAAAAPHGNIQVIEMLLEAGADVNAPAAHDYGLTALQGAAIRGFIGIVIILLNAGADVNAPAARYEGRTALEGAVEHGRLDIVQLLINVGAGMSVPGNAGFERAIALAEKEGYYAVAGLLKARLRD